MKLKFNEAVAVWTSLLDSEDPASYEMFEAAERTILSHRPRDEEQAQAMTRVLAFNLQTGERFDGLDRTAIETLAAWRLASADSQTLTALRRTRRAAEPRHIDP